MTSNMPKHRYGANRQPERLLALHPYTRAGKLWEWVQTTWAGFTLNQKIWSVAVSLALLLLLPRILLLGLIVVERVIVGSLLAAEEVIAALLFKSAAAVSSA